MSNTNIPPPRIGSQIPFKPGPDGCDELQDLLENPQHTDLGNASRLIKLYGQAVRWCPDFNTWLVWNGKYWERDARGKIYTAAQRTISNMIYEAGAMEPGRERTALLKWALASQAHFKVMAMVSMARYMEGIPILQDELDRDIDLLNLENGTLHLEQGIVRDHEQVDYITKTTSVTSLENWEAPRWIQFLHEVLPDEATVDFLQKAVGYSISGDISARAFFILYGTGRNGKSTFLSTIQHLLKDYACTTPVETLMRKWGDSGSGIPNDLAALKGVRFVTAYESGKGMWLNEGKVKQMTGGDPISARFMRAEYFTFEPEFKIWLCTNHKPTIRGVDDAIWDRIKLIPFTIRIRDHEVDLYLGDKLRAELPGILNWAVAGYQRFKEEGLGNCSEVELATKVYRTDMDIIRSFIDAYYLLDVASKMRSSDVYHDYQTWCEDEGEKPVSAGKLKGELEEHGIRYKHASDGRYYMGLMKNLDSGG